METKALVNLRIDGKAVEVSEGATILEAARQNGIHIPTLCHHPDLSPYGGCRLCVVEVDGSPRLVASCVTPVRNGMEVVTTSENIARSRRTILEFLFSEKSHYCMYCAQSGDCELQSLAYEYGMEHLTVPPLDQDFPVDTSHPDLVIDHNRCVLCGRCVRACRELAGQSILDFQNRGGRVMIGADLANRLGDSGCISCGVCLQVCPTGAIFHRHRTHYAVKGKSREWTVIDSCCPVCGLLCPTTNYVQDNNLIKIESREPFVGPDQGMLCRRGRFEPFKFHESRLLEPMIRDEKGQWHPSSLENALDRIAASLVSVREAHGRESIFGLISPCCSNEELAGFKSLMAESLAGCYTDTLDGVGYRNWIWAAQNNGGNVREAPWPSILEADLVLQVGADPGLTHPIVNALIRRVILEGKADLCVLGGQNRVGDLAELFFPGEGEELSPLLALFLSRVKNRGGAKAPSGFPARWDYEKFSALVAQYQESIDPVIVIDNTLSPAGMQSVLDLARIKGNRPDGSSRLILLKSGGNSTGAWSLDIPARKATRAEAELKGGLICLCGEDSPDFDLSWDLEFLAVISPYFPGPLVDWAHVLFPMPVWTEIDGTYSLAFGRESRFKPRALAPPPGVGPAVETLAALAARLNEKHSLPGTA